MARKPTGRPHGRPKGRLSSNPTRYSVYDRRTDFPVIIGGTARECAAAMNITLTSFYNAYSRLKNGYKNASRKWEIFRDEPMEEEECTK